MYCRLERWRVVFRWSLDLDIEASTCARTRSNSVRLVNWVARVPEPFTLLQLQHTYEVVLGRTVDKSTFRKRMLDAGFLKEAGMDGGATGRSAVTYRVKDRTQAVAFPRSYTVSE